MDREILIWAAASVPVLLVGTWLGSWAFARARPHHHRMTALAVLTALAIMLIVRSLFD